MILHASELNKNVNELTQTQREDTKRTLCLGRVVITDGWEKRVKKNPRILEH